MAKKFKWKAGDLFVIPLINKKLCIGQVLDLQMPNIVRIALYDKVIDNINYNNLNRLNQFVKLNNLISLIATSTEKLDNKEWKVIGNKDVEIPISKYPNEEFRSKGWVGAIHYDSGLVEDFINSFFSLLPWDDWHNPNFLDEFLIDPNIKPENLLYIKANK